MRADGSHERQLAWQVPAGYLTPSVISPSGDLFAFANYDGDCHIDCLINIAIAPRVGSPSQDITHNDPIWSLGCPAELAADTPAMTTPRTRRGRGVTGAWALLRAQLGSVV